MDRKIEVEMIQFIKSISLRGREEGKEIDMRDQFELTLKRATRGKVAINKLEWFTYGQASNLTRLQTCGLDSGFEEAKVSNM